MVRARANSSSEKSAGATDAIDRASRRDHRGRRKLAVLVVLASALSATALLHSRFANAELENSVFTSKTDGLQLVVPRGWRATDQPSYPGLLLWMMRSEPEGRIVLTSEPFTRDVYCSWPVRCQMSHDALPAKLACALGAKLEAQRLHVGPVQAGPKENEDAGLPSVWFEYDDGHHFMRQAVAINEDHVVSLVLSAPSNEARNAQVRAFEQALRTLRPLTPAELGTQVAPGTPVPVTPGGSAATASATPTARVVAAGSATSGSAAAAATGSATGTAGSAATPARGAAAAGSAAAGSAAIGSAAAGSAAGSAAAGSAAAPVPGAVVFSSAPAPRVEPIGPCPRK